MRIRDMDEPVWTVEEVAEELGQILQAEDRDALKLLVSNCSNWKDCTDLLPKMVELALKPDKPRKRGRPATPEKREDYLALGCLAKASQDKKTYSQTWRTYRTKNSLYGQPKKPDKSLTGEMALDYLTTSACVKNDNKRIAVNRFKLRK